MKRYAWFIGLLIIAASATPALAQKSPEEALKSFTVADGLEISLFASEPMFVNPTCIDVDHKGRVWVCESVNYRTQLRKVKPNRPEGDRIVVLEDTDADGKADKSHTFYQAPDFIAPLGIAVAPQASRDREGAESLKVYVCHSPHIYVFEDKDGDLKADDKPAVLLTGFKGYDHDHGVHGIHFGPDGKLYFSVGDQGVDGLKASGGREAPGEKVWKSNNTDCRAGTVWRCDADGKNLELLAHNFRNQYEPAVDSFGTLFVSDNDDDGNQQTRICYVMYGGNYGYHPRGKGESHWHEEQPGVVHKVLRTWFGSPTGLCWYEGTLLQASLQAGRRVPEPAGSGPESLLLHTDAGPRHVRCYHVKPKGAGYELEQDNIVTSTDNWFRPSDVCVAPDGSVFVSDWYDPGVGGHGMGDTTRGRLYRLTPKGHQGYKVPAVDLSNDKGTAAALSSPNLAARYMAVEKIRSLDDNKAKPILEEGLKQKEDVWLQARASWLLHSRQDFEFFKLMFELPKLGEKDERFRIQLIRILSQGGNFLRGALPIEFDGTASRRELLLGLRNFDPAEAKDLIWKLAQHYDGQDHFYLAAIGIAVGQDPKRREVILADFEKHFPEWNDKVAQLVWELRPPGVIASLDRKLADPKLTAAQKGQILDILAVTDDGSGGKTVLKLLADTNTAPELRNQAWKVLQTHLPSRWSALKKSPEMKTAIDRLLACNDHLVMAAELVALAELDDYADTLVNIADTETFPKEARQAAVRSLGAFKTEKVTHAVVRMLEKEALRKDALETLGKQATNPALEALQAIMKDGKQPLEQREAAVAALASSRPGTIALLEAHEGKKLPPELIPEAGRLLRNSPYQDLRNKALIAFPAPGKIDPKKLPEIAKLVGRKGDANHGRQLFATHKDLGCLRCHSVRGSGGAIGPDLSMVGKKAGRDNLFESILLPDKAIADQYLRWVVETKAGLLIDGLLIEETPEHVLLRDALGKDTKVLKKDVESRTKSPNSLMPGDLLAHMTEQDLVDMVDYLSTLKTPALNVDAWHILGPFDNLTGDAGLDKAYLPEPSGGRKPPGIDLKATYQAKTGNVTWKTSKASSTGYVDLQAHFGNDANQIVSYLYREIDSPVDQDATLLIGTDDGAKLWINGEQVYAHKQHRAAQPEQDQVQIKLKKGANAILLKINNGDGPHGFYFTVVSENELKLVSIR